MDLNRLEDRLYSSREVAQLLGVSLRTIYRYIESGKLVPETQTRSGRHLFGKEAILRFLYPDAKDKRIERGRDRETEGREWKVEGGDEVGGLRVESGDEKGELKVEGEDEGGELGVEDKDESRNLRVEGAEEKLEEKGPKEEIPVEKGEIKFPLEKKTEEIKLTKEGAVAPRHERDILKELS